MATRCRYIHHGNERVSRKFLFTDDDDNVVHNIHITRQRASGRHQVPPEVIPHVLLRMLLSTREEKSWKEGRREGRKKKKKEGRMKANEGRKLSPGNTYTARLRSVLCACALGRFLQFLVLPGVHLLNTWNGGSECTAIRRDECSRALRSRQKAACYSPLNPSYLPRLFSADFFLHFFVSLLSFFLLIGDLSSASRNLSDACRKISAIRA